MIKIPDIIYKHVPLNHTSDSKFHKLQFDAGEVTLWWFPTAKYTLSLLSCYRTLQQSERLKANNLRVNPWSYIFSRGMLRHILSNYLHCFPSEVNFMYQTYGKPVINNYLSFNVAHSHEGIAIALTCHEELGIDLEYEVPRTSIADFAKIYFTRNEQTSLEETTAENRLIYFYRIWTSKEAVMKACGKGIALLPNSFNIPLLNNFNDEVITANLGKNWYITNIMLSRTYYLAIAMSIPISRLNIYQVSELEG